MDPSIVCTSTLHCFQSEKLQPTSIKGLVEAFVESVYKQAAASLKVLYRVLRCEEILALRFQSPLSPHHSRSHYAYKLLLYAPQTFENRPLVECMNLKYSLT